MKPYTLIGILLVLATVAAFAYQGRGLITSETVADFRMLARGMSSHQLLPILGVLALGNGIGLLIKRKGRTG